MSRKNNLLAESRGCARSQFSAILPVVVVVELVSLPIGRAQLSLTHSRRTDPQAAHGPTEGRP